MQVRSKHTTAVQIQLYEEKEIDGRKMFWRTGDPVIIRPGENEVDDEFMKKWFEQNLNQSVVEKI